MKGVVAHVGVMAAVLAAGAVQAQAPAPAAAGNAALSARVAEVDPFVGGFAALRAQRWEEATRQLARVVNAQDAERRGQARFGLAVAYSQLGQEAQALRALEGTLVDESQLGQAVAQLRGRLLLQLADKALAEEGPGAAEKWISQYERLTVKPDGERYARIKGAWQAKEGDLPTAILRVGVLLPLEGKLAPVGADILRGLQMGLKDFDGRRGARVELLPLHADSAEEGRAAARQVLAQKADVVLGPLTSAAVEGAKEVLAPAKVPMLVFSSDRVVLGEGVHALNYLPAEQARVAARVAMARGATRVAGLVPSTPYGYEVFDAFQDEAKRLGGTVAGSAFYNPANNDIGASIRTLVDTVSGTTNSFTRPFDALFLPAPGTTLPLVTAQLSYYDVDKPDAEGKKPLMLGTALWQDPAVLAPSASGVRGGMFAVPATASAFEQRFENVFGAKPHPLAVLGYDAMRVMADVAAERERTKAGVEALLLREEGYYGSAGYIRFDDKGVTARGLNVVKVGEQFEVVKEALNLAPLPLPKDLQPSAKARAGWW